MFEDEEDIGIYNLKCRQNHRRIWSIKSGLDYFLGEVRAEKQSSCCMRGTNTQLKDSRESRSHQLPLLGQSWWGCGVESDSGVGTGQAGFLGKVPFKELWAWLSKEK